MVEDMVAYHGRVGSFFSLSFHVPIFWYHRSCINRGCGRRIHIHSMESDDGQHRVATAVEANLEELPVIDWCHHLEKENPT